jgi:hypothetical protein
MPAQLEVGLHFSGRWPSRLPLSTAFPRIEELSGSAQQQAAATLSRPPALEVALDKLSLQGAQQALASQARLVERRDDQQRQHHHQHVAVPRAPSAPPTARETDGEKAVREHLYPTAQ